MSGKRRRKWLQFSLASLLLVMTVLGIGLGLWADSARRQQRAVEFLREKGGRIEYSHQVAGGAKATLPGPAWIRNWMGIDYVDHVARAGFQDIPITDADLAAIRDLPRLTSVLIFETPNVTDAGLAHLGNLTKLKEATLRSDQITDAGLAHLAGLKNLHNVYLESSRITDGGLEHLKNLHKLDIVFLASDQITDAGLLHLGGLDQLHRLEVRSNGITDAGLAHLKDLPLYVLSLESDNISDAGLVHLRSHTMLQDLLLDCPVTDAGMQHLTECRDLESLLCRGSPSDKPHRDLYNRVREPGRIHDAEWTPHSLILHLDDFYGVAVRLDAEAMLAAGIDPCTQFTCDPRGLRRKHLRETLDALLPPHGLGWYIGDGELVITSLEVDNEKHAGINSLRAALPKLKDVEYAW